MGPYPLHTEPAWCPDWDAQGVQDMIEDVPDHPNIWSDSSMEPIPHLDVEVAGAGGAGLLMSVLAFLMNYDGEHVQDLDGRLMAASIFSSISGPLQTVQSAEYWGVIFALQASSAIHVGIDNLTVLNELARLLAQDNMGPPPCSTLFLVKDGDLPATIHSMLRNRGFQG